MRPAGAIGRMKRGGIGGIVAVDCIVGGEGEVDVGRRNRAELWSVIDNSSVTITTDPNLGPLLCNYSPCLGAYSGKFQFTICVLYPKPCKLTE